MVMPVVEEPTAQDDQPTDAAVPQGDNAAEDEAAAPAEETDAADVEAEEAADAPDEAEAPAEPAIDDKKKWYVVKVQSGREESIKDAIERRVKIEGAEACFGRIIIPVERVSEMVRGKRVVREKKLFPGYLMVNVEYNDSILYLFRETSGVGDFVGASLNHPPQPMSDKEVEFMLMRIEGEAEVVSGKVPTSKFDVGDRVKVKDGTFAGMEGEVKEKLEAKGALKVELTIFGRPVPVELEYWQVEYA